MGGIVGGSGYQFQDAYITSKIPVWLQENDFDHLVKEGFGDVDVHYLSNDRKRRSHIQIKNHQVAPAEFREVLSHFKQLDAADPEIFEKFILASMGLSPNMMQIKAALNRYKSARHSYEGHLAATEADVRRMMAGLKVEGDFDFICGKVDFDDELLGLADHNKLKSLFCGDLAKVYAYAGPSQRAAFDAIHSLISGTTGKPVTKQELIALIENAVKRQKSEIEESGFPLRVYHWEDEPFIDKPSFGAVLDWSDKFNRRERRVPSPAIWERELIPQLISLQQNLRRTTPERRIILEGSSSLSAGVVIGQAFPEVGEWILQVTPRVGDKSVLWSSVAARKDIVLPYKVETNEEGEDLAVKWGVVADVSSDFIKYCRESNQTYRTILEISKPDGSDGILSNEDVLAYCRCAKNIIREQAKQHSAKKVHLFFAGPVGMAIFFGHLLNSMPSFQLYEQKLGGGYVASAFLPET